MPPPLVGLKNVPHFLCAALTFPALGCSFCKPFLVLGREHTSLVFKFRCLYVRKILLNYKELLSPSMLASDKPGCWKIFSGGLDHEVLEKKEVISIKGVTSVFWKLISFPFLSSLFFFLFLSFFMPPTQKKGGHCCVRKYSVGLQHWAIVNLRSQAEGWFCFSWGMILFYFWGWKWNKKKVKFLNFLLLTYFLTSFLKLLFLVTSSMSKRITFSTLFSSSASS